MQIESYLFFNGNCEEALNFYAQALGGKVTAMMRYEGMPPGDMEVPANWKQKVMHSNFEAEGAKFMASDAMPGSPPTQYSGFSMSLYVEKDKAKAKKYFDALAAGGKVTMPFEPPFWGGTFGMLTDKFGVPWMVSCEEA
jgi:PhnB protein